MYTIYVVCIINKLYMLLCIKVVYIQYNIPWLGPTILEGPLLTHEFINRGRSKAANYLSICNSNLPVSSINNKSN